MKIYFRTPIKILLFYKIVDIKRFKATKNIDDIKFGSVQFRSLNGLYT